MAKKVNISNSPLLGFTELIFWKNTASFNEVSLASIIRSFPFECMAKPPACRTGAWDTGLDQSFRKDRFLGPEGIHRILRQATGGTSEREHTQIFLWNYDSPSLP